ncbi:hypothetical protein [Formivibrio citricus]|nr:hypothetical protein [Formivibrio citricus]
MPGYKTRAIATMADGFPFPLASAEEVERDPGSRPTEGSAERRKAGAHWG